jgi:hypothetical protein
LDELPPGRVTDRVVVWLEGVGCIVVLPVQNVVMPAGDVLEERAGYVDAVELVDGIRCGQNQVWRVVVTDTRQ